jgi:hypothetical protein
MRLLQIHQLGIDANHLERFGWTGFDDHSELDTVSSLPIWYANAPDAVRLQLDAVKLNLAAGL